MANNGALRGRVCCVWLKTALGWIEQTKNWTFEIQNQPKVA